MKEVRTCRFCDEPLNPDDPDALFSVKNEFTGVFYGDMHLSCAQENLPPGEYKGWRWRGRPVYFRVIRGDGDGE